jgi:hypothetical protein
MIKNGTKGYDCFPRAYIYADFSQMMPSEPLCNVTTPSIELGDMGPFALIAHATRLLGQVLKHVSDPSRLDEEEAILLDGTLRALYQVVIIEGQLRAVHMLNQQAICSM